MIYKCSLHVNKKRACFLARSTTRNAPIGSAVERGTTIPVGPTSSASVSGRNAMADFAENLRRLMARLDLTIESAADRAGLDPRTVKGILRGDRPHARTL